MKQLLLLITFSIVFISAFSQLNKHQIFTGGSLSFKSGRYNSFEYISKERYLELTSDIGYFLFDKLAIGSAIGFSYYKTLSNFSQLSSTSLNLSPLVRYYIFSKDSRINLFGEIEYNYSIAKDKAYNFSDSTHQEPSKRIETGFSYKAGPVFFINPSIALELSLNYSSSTYNDNSKASQLLTGLGLQIHLGNKKSKQ